MGSYLLYEKSTLKEISELLGRETIDSLNQSENRGAQTSHGLSYQKLGKELMTQDEIAVMDGGKCILKLRGVRPFFSDIPFSLRWSCCDILCKPWEITAPCRSSVLSK